MTAAAATGPTATATAPRGLLRAAITVEARKARSAHVMLWTTVLSSSASECWPSGSSRPWHPVRSR